MEATKTSAKPALGPKWFWDMDYDRIDWQASYKSIIARIVERGGPEHWEELIRFYGRETFLKALKNGIVFLPDYAIDKVSFYFRIEKRKCYATYGNSRNQDTGYDRTLVSDTKFQEFFFVGGAAWSLKLGYRTPSGKIQQPIGTQPRCFKSHLKVHFQPLLFARQLRNIIY